jgi:hypothetical protein
MISLLSKTVPPGGCAGPGTAVVIPLGALGAGVVLLGIGFTFITLYLSCNLVRLSVALVLGKEEERKAVERQCTSSKIIGMH